jgi:hypothetical protein
MTFKLLAASAVLALAAATPASAQLLGSGTVGGNLGGAVNGALGGVGSGLGSNLGRDVGSATNGTLRGSASGRAERSVDTRSGRASGRAGASGGLAGSLDKSASLALGSGNASANGSADASKDASFGIDAVGTDVARGAAEGALRTVTGAAGSLSVPTLGGVGGGGNASGSGSGSGEASGGFGGLGSLAAAGSAAANAAGTFAVGPGMIVRDGSGRAVGEVQTLRTTASGMVDAVVVEVGNRLATLPADNFTVSGETLVSAMSRGEVRREAQAQETGG